MRRRKIGLWLPYQEWFATSPEVSGFLDQLTDSNSKLAAYAERSVLISTVESFRKESNRHAGLLLQRFAEVELWLRSLPTDAPRHLH